VFICVCVTLCVSARLCVYKFYAWKRYTGVYVSPVRYTKCKLTGDAVVAVIIQCILYVSAIFMYPVTTFTALYPVFVISLSTNQTACWVLLPLCTFLPLLWCFSIALFWFSRFLLASFLRFHCFSLLSVFSICFCILPGFCLRYLYFDFSSFQAWISSSPAELLQNFWMVTL